MPRAGIGPYLAMASPHRQVRSAAEALLPRTRAARPHQPVPCLDWLPGWRLFGRTPHQAHDQSSKAKRPAGPGGPPHPAAPGTAAGKSIFHAGSAAFALTVILDGRVPHDFDRLLERIGSIPRLPSFGPARSLPSFVVFFLHHFLRIFLSSSLHGHCQSTTTTSPPSSSRFPRACPGAAAGCARARARALP